MPKYLALTIGPIVKTLMEARKTRELWAASYLLSSLMGRIKMNLDSGGGNVLIPAIPPAVLNKPLYGSGIYPDRLFMLADHFYADAKVQEAPADKRDAVVEELIEAKILESIRSLAKDCLLAAEGQDQATIDKATEFWRDFFRIRWVIRELSDITAGRLSIELSPFLDSLELEDTCFPKEPERNYLYELFVPDRLFHCDLIKALKAGKGRYDGIMRGVSVFPSTSDIAAFELYQKHPAEMKDLEWDHLNEKHEVFYQEILNDKDVLRPAFRQYHKYFCILQADGDGIGNAIKQLGVPKDYSDFSTALADYGADAADIINKHGGKPIYIGGDDLLLLCPVCSDKGTVFDLINDLDTAFQKVNLKVPVSLSYGLNIVYYKYPLFEAIGEAYGILKKAKKYKTAQGAKKNSVSFQFTKHSGSAFQGVFSKAFLGVISDAMQHFREDPNSRRSGVVSSLIYKLLTLEKLFADLLEHAKNKEERAERLEATMTYFFNEWEDSQWFDRQRKAVIELLEAAVAERGADRKALELFYATMRLLQFMMVSPKNTLQYDTEDIAQAAG